MFESIQTENYQIKNTKTAWLLSKLNVTRQLKRRLKMIIQTERFRESSWKHCKTATLYGKRSSRIFWFATLGVCEKSITF